MAKKLKKPKSSFHDWLKDVPGNKFLEDIHHLFGLGYCVTEQSSPFTRAEKLKYSRQICEKIEQRYDEYMGGQWGWDGRRWRWYYKILEILKKKREWRSSFPKK